uniref:Helicase ATP-binding domain-containing protein n=1 Tax=Rhabditophanes sp. KR3021 TaxID=114890 RepID=A0AC35UB95_9BILA
MTDAKKAKVLTSFIDQFYEEKVGGSQRKLSVAAPTTIQTFDDVKKTLKRIGQNRLGKSLDQARVGKYLRNRLPGIEHSLPKTAQPTLRRLGGEEDGEFMAEHQQQINQLKDACWANLSRKVRFLKKKKHLFGNHLISSPAALVGSSNSKHVCLKQHSCKEIQDDWRVNVESTLISSDTFTKLITDSFLQDAAFGQWDPNQILNEDSGTAKELRSSDLDDGNKDPLNPFNEMFHDLKTDLEATQIGGEVVFEVVATSRSTGGQLCESECVAWDRSLIAADGTEEKFLKDFNLLLQHSNKQVKAIDQRFDVRVLDDEGEWVSSDEDDADEGVVVDNTVPPSPSSNLEVGETVGSDDAGEEVVVSEAECLSDKDDTSMEETPLVTAQPILHYHSVPLQSKYPMAHVISRQVTEEFFSKIDPSFFAPYKFTLDYFQKQACVAIANNGNVFVAAHTSAGKTVIAEFACRFYTQTMKKVFYTSPIKALSNQKYSDFREIFDDVGLVTGDSQINREGQIIIVTTEILQSMLYNDSQEISELGCVVFDEVHYVNNVERGHVWEEILIMLPKHIKVVMLSATVPNYLEFSDWVGRVLDDKVLCINTFMRPVQLEHLLYMDVNNDQTKNFMTIMKGDRGTFNIKGFTALATQLKQSAKNGNKKVGNTGNKSSFAPGNNMAKQAANKAIANHNATKGPNSAGSFDGTHRNLYTTLIRHLHFDKSGNGETKTPMVVFVFSRKQCDNYVAMLHNVDLTTSEEKYHVTNIFTHAKALLDEDNLQLPQLIFVEESCKRGIAMHHSGMLPFLKEVVEIAFSRGYVKVLFATETFAMGINMPTKTAVFDSIEKFDGQAKRLLTSTEYVQMAGRAGRRGLDKAGFVIILCKNKKLPNVDEMQKLLKGQNVSLSSKFLVTTSMVLNVFQRECRSIKDFISKSFAESDTLRIVENIDAERAELNSELDSFVGERCAICETDPNYGTEFLIENNVNLIQARSEYFCLIGPNLPPSQLGNGRIIIVDVPQYNLIHVLAVVSSVRHDKMNLIVLVKKGCVIGKEKPVKMGCLRLEKEQLALYWRLKASFYGNEESVNESMCSGADCQFKVIGDVHMSNLIGVISKSISMEELKQLHHDVIIANKKPIYCESRNMVKIKIKLQGIGAKLTARNQDSSLLLKLKPIEDFDIDIHLTIMKETKLVLKTKKFPCRECAHGCEHYEKSIHIYFIQERLKLLSSKLNVESLEVYEMYENKVKALKKLDFLESQTTALDHSEENTIISFKGRSACRMGSSHVVLTELLYQGLLKDKSPEYIGAMVSIMASQGQRDFAQHPEPDETIERMPVSELEEIKNVFKTTHDYIHDAFVEFQTVNEDYIESYSENMIEVAYLWMKGVSLIDIMKIHTLPEGNIVRNLRKTWDLLNGMQLVLEHMGSRDQAAKIEDMTKKMARGIVFSASLYTVVAEKDNKKVII